MKKYIFVKWLVADSGHEIIYIEAKNKAQAIEKIKTFSLYKVSEGDLIEIKEDVQTVFEYDNPNYEG